MDKGTAAESQRIVDVYARRAKVVPPSRYSAFSPSHLALLQELERRLLRVVGSHMQRSLENKTILEVGCETGHWLRKFVQWGAAPRNLAGVDLRADQIALARELCPSGIRLECQEASTLDFSSGSFDIVLQATVFSSILDTETKAAVAREMLRVLRPDGFILWYDFFVNNPRNPDVRGIGKKELHRLFPDCSIHFERITLAPPLGRLLGRISLVAYNLVSALRFASTHYLAVIEKHEPQS